MALIMNHVAKERIKVIVVIVKVRQAIRLPVLSQNCVCSGAHSVSDVGVAAIALMQFSYKNWDEWQGVCPNRKCGNYEGLAESTGKNFDGSRNIPHWQKAVAFAQSAGFAGGLGNGFFVTTFAVEFETET